MISFIVRGRFLPQVGDLDRLALRESRCDVRLVEADVLLRERVNQLLIHAVGGAQMKFALQIVEDVDRAGLGAGQLHRLGDDGGEHGLQIERRVHRLGHFAERAQFLDRAAKLIGALAQLCQQPRVLNCDDRLAGEARYQRDLLVRKGSDLVARQSEGADQFVFLQHWDNEEGTNAPKFDGGNGRRITFCISSEAATSAM